MPQSAAVIVSAVRTPFGKFGGALSPLKATDLGGVAIRGALERAGLAGREADIDYICMGMVVQAGAGQIPSRQAAAAAGMPMSVPSDTINKVCASSMRAVNLAAALIRAGEIHTAVAGGMESMSNVPYLVPRARWGLRMGNAELVDGMIHDGLWCAWHNCHMGTHGNHGATESRIPRQEQDEWAYRSHRLAHAAWQEGRFDAEVVPVPVPQKKGDPVPVTRDEGIRPDTTVEKLAALRPAFDPNGSVTAGNAPPVNDGASALVIMSAARAAAWGLEPLATVVASGTVSDAPANLHTVPAQAGRQALQKAGLSAGDLERVEINEAFAAVTIASTRLLGVDPAIVNVNGGAIAIGHPIGASGGRILATLIHELRRRGGGYGLAAICSGGGQGEATLVRVG